MHSSELKGFLTGLMFGDGYIDKGVTKRGFRIKTIYSDFADDIANKLQSCTFDLSNNYHQARDSNGVHHKEYWEIITKAHPYFAKKYHHFYNDNRKRRISKEAMNWLTPMGLAYWYMSDGYIYLVGKTKGFIRDRRIDLCTDRFSYDTVVAITNMLQSKYNLQCSIIKRNDRYRVRIKRDSYSTFYNLIAQYIFPIKSMQYKLYFGYNTKPDWMNDQMWQLQLELRSATTLTDNAEG